jgi:hypothetical protein
MVKDLRVVFGKGDGSEPVPHDANGCAPMWKNKSIFWELPYWEILEVRNAIDMMHLTKNLCLNVPGFLGWYKNSKCRGQPRGFPKKPGESRLKPAKTQNTNTPRT